MKKYIILVVTCLFIGFISGRQTVSIKEKEVTKYVQGGTIRDTIAQLVPDTVYLAGELKNRCKKKRPEPDKLLMGLQFRQMTGTGSEALKVVKMI